MPAGMTADEEQAWVERMKDRLSRSRNRTRTASDEELDRRARLLAERYFDDPAGRLLHPLRRQSEPPVRQLHSFHTDDSPVPSLGRHAHVGIRLRDRARVGAPDRGQSLQEVLATCEPVSQDRAGPWLPHRQGVGASGHRAGGSRRSVRASKLRRRRRSSDSLLAGISPGSESGTCFQTTLED